MNTRCQLGFYELEEENLENWEALVYRHTDGYPDAVLADLLPILEDVREMGGFFDIEYLSAFVVSELKTDFRNIGISKHFHGDIDFYYAIFQDRILIYQCRYSQPHIEWRLIKTISLGGEKK